MVRSLLVSCASWCWACATVRDAKPVVDEVLYGSNTHESTSAHGMSAFHSAGCAPAHFSYRGILGASGAVQQGYCLHFRQVCCGASFNGCRVHGNWDERAELGSRFMQQVFAGYHGTCHACVVYSC